MKVGDESYSILVQMVQFLATVTGHSKINTVKSQQNMRVN